MNKYWSLSKVWAKFEQILNTFVTIKLFRWLLFNKLKCFIYQNMHKERKRYFFRREHSFLKGESWMYPDNKGRDVNVSGWEADDSQNEEYAKVLFIKKKKKLNPRVV